MARWMETGERQVAEMRLGPLRISTVFVGLDYSFGLNGSDGEHVPVLFETIIFDDDVEDYQTHCCTWEQAEAMHVKAVAVATDWAKAGETAVARLKELLEDRHDGQASN